MSDILIRSNMPYHCRASDCCTSARVNIYRLAQAEINNLFDQAA